VYRTSWLCTDDKTVVMKTVKATPGYTMGVQTVVSILRHSLTGTKYKRMAATMQAK